MTEYEASKILDDYIKLPEIFQFYGYEIKHGFCCCPFHNEDTPSCKVNDYIYHCFGCGAKGNAISFVKGLFNLDFKTSIQKLNDDFNLGLLNTHLTEEQKIQIKKRKQIIYAKKQEELELEQIKQQYFEAWKHYVFYKPEEKNYNIDTPEFLVDEYFESIDKRYLAAIETIKMLEDYAEIYNFKIEEFEARQLFIEGRKPSADDKVVQELARWGMRKKEE